MRKKFLASVLIMLLSASSIGQTFEPLDVDALEPVTFVPSYTSPVVQIKKADGELIRNVRIPEGGNAASLTFDNKYLIVMGKSAIYRVAIYEEEVISVPIEMMETNSDGTITSKVPVSFFTQSSAKAYLYESKDMYGESIKDEINIYEVDFDQQKVSHYMTLSVNSKRYNIVGSYYNKYLVACTKPGKVDVYNIENKSLFRSLSFDIPESWGNRKVDAFIPYLMGTELRYGMHNFGSSDATQKSAFVASFDLLENKVLHQEFRTGEDAGVVFSYHPKTRKIYWTKSYNEGEITQWKKQIFDDEALTNMVFEFTGALMWQFDQKAPELLHVTYHSGKIESYNLTTKELVATKNNGGGLNDF